MAKPQPNNTIAAAAAVAAGLEGGAAANVRADPPNDEGKQPDQVAQNQTATQPAGIIVSPETLSQIIAGAIAQGVAAALAAAKADDPEAPPPPDPAEIQSEIEKQLSEARYLIQISKGDKQCVDPVPIGVNGILRTVKRGEFAIVTQSMLEVLENSIEKHIDPETLEPFEVSSYPYTVFGEIAEEEWSKTLGEIVDRYAPKRNNVRGSGRPAPAPVA